MPKIPKRLDYRRARFLEDGQNLEQLVRQVWDRFGTQAERTITFGDGRSTCGLRSYDFADGGFAVHCARYTDGQGVGTITTTPTPQVEVANRAPEPGENFLNSDLMALFHENHVICMNCGPKAASLRIYFQRLFQNAEFPEASQMFLLDRVGSPDKIAIINRASVKSIDLSLSISEATATYLMDDTHDPGLWQSTKSILRSALVSVIALDESIGRLRLAERGTVKVSINVPKGDLDAAKHGLDDFAEELVKDDEADDFVIHLRDGTIIKPNEVSVQKQVRLDAAANSVSVFQAWNEMDTFMGELIEDGQLEA